MLSLAGTFYLLALLSGLDQPTPDITPQFMCRLYVDIRVMLTHYILSGNLVVDAKSKGMFASLYGDDPNNYWGKLNTTVVVHPEDNNKGITVWEVKNNICETVGNASDSQIPPLSIPKDATYRGTLTVEDKICDIWRIYSPYQGVSYCDVFVNQTNVMLVEALYSTTAQISVYISVSFRDYFIGPPDKSYFNKPGACK